MLKVSILLLVFSLSSFGNEDIKLIKKFGKTLSKNLKTAVKKSGLNAGVEFCNENALSLKENFAKKHKVIIGRTSNKYRNSKNKPEKWMIPILKEYETSNAKNKMKPKKVNGYTFAPIYVKGLCLNCHGSSIAKNVSKTLNQKYPKDLATGYKAGEFRGLFYLKQAK